MTSTELKDLLLSIAGTLEVGQKVFPMKIDEVLIKILSNMDDTSTQIMSLLLHVSADELKAAIPETLKLAQPAQELFGTAEAAQISSFCRRIADRPMLLMMISKL